MEKIVTIFFESFCHIWITRMLEQTSFLCRLSLFEDEEEEEQMGNSDPRSAFSPVRN